MAGLTSYFDPPEGHTVYLGDPTGISAYASQQTNSANAYIIQLGALSASLAPPVISSEFPDAGIAPALISATPPTMEPVLWTAPDAPAAFTSVLDIGDFMPAPFDEDPPELLFGTAPTAFTDNAPDAPGIDLVFDYPELELTLPAAPSLLALSITPFDGLNMPTIDFTLPELTVAAPSIREYTPGADYTSSLLTSLKASLEDRIVNGGTGLAADVETAIWDRGREREARSAADAQAELERMETLGYSLPPGVYLDARLKIATELAYAGRGYGREVAIKQAELEQSNVLAALATSTQLESASMSYANQVEQRLFDSCKYATEAGVAIYNAQVQAYAAYLDAYKTKVNIYEALVRGELARVDAYKATIQAEQAKADINRSLVEQYKVQVEAALANVEVFKARIGVIQTRAEIEKTKVMVFGEQVRAYAARIGAYTAGVEGFRATIQAEGAKQDAFRSQVDAYKAQVEAGTKVIDSRIAAFRANLEANTSAWEAYKSAYQAQSARAQAIAAGNSSLAESYKAQVQGIASYNEVLTKQWSVAFDQARAVSEIGVGTAKANAELYVTTRSLALDAAKVGAQVSAQLGAAALNAINWSQSYSTSFGVSNGFSQSDSSSSSDSTSTSYNYNYSV